MGQGSGLSRGVAAALDIGSTKICCFIARAESTDAVHHEGEPLSGGAVRIIGIGHQVSQGVRHGAITEMHAAEVAIRAAVDSAERMAGQTIDNIIVNISAGAPESHNIDVDLSVNGHEIGDRDLATIDEQCRVEFDAGDREIIHAIPTSYSVDDNNSVRNPRGMYGETLGVSMHFLTAALGPLRNVGVCVERCHLELGGRVLSPYASGLATLLKDERDLGAVCVDMGGGTTTFSVFAGGTMVHADMLRVGGHHITKDIARGLSTSLTHAERIKTLYGSALPSTSDEREMIEVPMLGDDGGVNQIPRSLLTGIVKPRVEETVELVRDRLRASGFDKVAARNVVLTGGGSQLNGVRETAGRILERQARPGRPICLQRLAEKMAGPEFATCAGLIAFGCGGTNDTMSGAPRIRRPPGAGRLSRIGQWLKENF